MSAPVVFLLDDQESVVLELARSLIADGFAVRTWTSAIEFLRAHDGATPGCLVMDVQMPGISGLELQHALRAQGTCRPIVFTSGGVNLATVVQAMKAGAVTFLSKPVTRIELLEAVYEALARDAAARQHQRERQYISNRLATLTPREREVLDLVAAGLRNKQIAHELQASEPTVKAHRCRLMKKMKVRNAPALVRLLSWRTSLETSSAARPARPSLPWNSRGPLSRAPGAPKFTPSLSTDAAESVDHLVKPGGRNRRRDSSPMIGRRLTAAQRTGHVFYSGVEGEIS